MERHKRIDQGVIIDYQPISDHRLHFKRTVIGKNYIFRTYATIYAGSIIGDNCHVGHHALIREENKIGDNCSIGSFCSIEPGNVIGNNVRIHSHCFIVNGDIGSDVFIGPRVTFTDDPHPPCPRYKECRGGPVIEDGAAIGAGAILLPGVLVGAGALVAAGTLVSRDVLPGEVVAGQDCRHLMMVSDLKCSAGLYEHPYVWKFEGKELDA